MLRCFGRSLAPSCSSFSCSLTLTVSLALALSRVRALFIYMSIVSRSTEQMDRLVAEHLARSGLLGTAQDLVQQSNLHALVDMHMLAQAAPIVEAVEKVGSQPLDQWLSRAIQQMLVRRGGGAQVSCFFLTLRNLGAFIRYHHTSHEFRPTLAILLNWPY